MPTEFVPATQTELARFMAENAAGGKQRLQPVGGRTALRGGLPGLPIDTVVDLRELCRVVDFPARDMTVTVEAGLRVDELRKLLATEGQQLPIDIAQAGRATIGGAIATNTSGPRRFGYGTFRDYLIGVSAVDAHGRLFKGGGRVVKNVAGYDLCKLLVGSRGTLGIITQVTMKLRPDPAALGWWWLAFDTLGEIENVVERLLTSSTRPIVVDVLNPIAARQVAADARLPLTREIPVLCLAFAGSPGEVEWQLESVRREAVPFGVQQLEQVTGEAARQLLSMLTEFPVNADVPLTFQANLLPSRTMEFAEQCSRRGVGVQCHAGNGIVIGQLPEETATVSQAGQTLQELRDLARAGHGNLLILNCDPEWQSHLPMCGAPEPSWPQMAQLKRQLDPHNVLNPGQFVDGTQARSRENHVHG